MDGGAGNDSMFGGSANDTMSGGTNEDRIEGGSGNDQLFGNDGNDTISGDSGADVMSGGLGADVFVFRSTGDSLNQLGGSDLITDFNTLFDRIDLSAIDANADVAGDQAFQLVLAGNGAGTLHVSVITTATGTVTQVEANTNADGIPDLVFQLSGSVALDSTDFLF